MKISWVRCHTYEEARNVSGAIYLHEWNGKPFYWGKEHQGFCNLDEPSYRHWIEGCLQHGGILFMGNPSSDALTRIDDIVSFLIHTHGHVMNSCQHPAIESLQIEHVGDLPTCLHQAHLPL